MAELFLRDSFTTDLSTMDTQQATDALTDHMAIYHRSAERLKTSNPLDAHIKTNFKSGVQGGNMMRHRVIEWLSGLSTFQRQAALTIFDRPWVLLLLQMQQKLNQNGPGNFIILPDIPASSIAVESNTKSVASLSTTHQKGKDKKGRANSNTRRVRGSKVSKVDNDDNLEYNRKIATESVGTLSNGNGSVADGISLPGLCYRKAYGLLLRLKNLISAEQRLIKSVRIFSSQDGVKGVAGCGPQPVFDSLTVTSELAENLNVFLEVVEELSSGGFLEHPLRLVASPWAETRWLQVQGYYSIAAFIANKLEISIWSSYNFSLGSKRFVKNSCSSKTSELLRSNRIPGRCIDILESAAIGQSLHGRKRGCVDWWDTVVSDVKEKTIRFALVAATKSEVINASSSAGNVARNTKPTKRPLEDSRASEYRGSSSKWTSLSDTEADQYKSNPQNSSIDPTLSPLLAGLAALKEVSELGFLPGGSSSSVTNNNRLFFSNLESVQTLSDRILRRSRHVLARVMNEAVEFELLEGEVGAKSLAAESARVGENKRSKEKKKRRRKSSVQKIAEVRNDLTNLADLANQPLEEGELARNEDVKGTALHSQRLKLLNEIVGSPESCTENIQSSKPHFRKSKTYKDKKFTQTESNVDINGEHKDRSQLDKFKANGSHKVDYEISDSNLVTGSCHSCDVGIKSATDPDCNLGEASSKFHSDHCISIIEPTGDNSERVVPDSVDEFHGSVTLKVLSPVEKEPSAGQARSDIFKMSTLRQNLEEPFDKPADDSGKCDLDFQCMNHRAFELCCGPVDVVASAVQLPVNLKPPSTSKAMAFYRTIPELQLLRKEASGNGRKSNSLIAPRIIEEGGIAARDVETTSEPLFDSNMRCGLRSQSLPSGVNSSGKLFTSRPTATFSPEEPVLVHNLKGGPLRSQHNPPAFAMFYSHEWPGYSQVRVSGSTVRPAASERLHLDVVHKRLSASSGSISNTAPAPPGSLEWPPFVHNAYSLAPVVGYSDSNDPKVVTLHSPFPSSPYASRIPPNGQTRIGDYDSEVEERLYDTDLETFESHAGDFEDFDGYVVSEEDERLNDDTTHMKAEDYNQFFGGGVMYWNSADYTGMGYSRPGSMSSDDSSWARREADLSLVLDDIVGIHPLSGSYRGKGSTNSNLSITSPSKPSTSLPLSFDQIAASQVGPRVCLTRSAESDFAANYGSISDDSQAAGPNVDTRMGVVDGVMSDGFMPRLRPIVVVRDNGLTRSMVKTEAVRLREARSPHIVSRGVHRDFCGGRRRQPSPPVIRHAPPPPPPSPVAGLKRRKGWMSARSGRSSPRYWGLTSWWNKDDVDSFDVQAVNRDNVLGNGRSTVVLASTPPIRPGAVPREHSVAMSSSALNQEHMADEALVMQSGVLYNKNPTLHLVITVYHTALHREIETFCLQVAAEKRLRMPFINTAVKKVAHSLQVLWPRSRAKIFGSNATGLALPTSDVDLVVSLPLVRKAREPIKQAGILEGRIDGVKETCLLHAARNLEDQDWIKSLQVIEHTMVPIIRLEAHILPHQCELGDISLSVKETCPMSTSSNTLHGLPTSQESGDFAGKEAPWGSEKDRQNVCLDISFEAPTNTGVRTSELVRELMGQFPPLTPLALVLKQFLADRGLDHAYKGGLSSYCQVLLITRFLQHQQHLGRPSSSQNLGSLFMDFLHFFGYVFDPRSMCVRIRGGGKYVSRDRSPSIDPLYIEDPFDYENNVGSTCFRIQQIVKAFADAYFILEKELFEVFATDEAKVEDNFNLLQKIIPSFVG
ncbi:hypothetical protein KC19_VG157000 [Ceratodon purpureus]|uniref:Polymerase nucleotidyl transferase domain-containing protein n=1 Tax=Ceratodon purpureus TaxID=3225 RepID=A0A8T0HQX7_CERPU|nr:hypothetical protein KC19_VG157000 [Ceratodon purpureus]